MVYNTMPVERVMGMGTTWESKGSTASQRIYLTIEYKQEGEMKYIVVRVKMKSEVKPLIKYFNQIKGTREMNKQEL